MLLRRAAIIQLQSLKSQTLNLEPSIRLMITLIYPYTAMQLNPPIWKYLSNN